MSSQTTSPNLRGCLSYSVTAILMHTETVLRLSETQHWLAVYNRVIYLQSLPPVLFQTILFMIRVWEGGREFEYLRAGLGKEKCSVFPRRERWGSCALNSSEAPCKSWLLKTAAVKLDWNFDDYSNQRIWPLFPRSPFGEIKTKC